MQGAIGWADRRCRQALGGALRETAEAEDDRDEDRVGGEAELALELQSIAWAIESSPN